MLVAPASLKDTCTGLRGQRPPQAPCAGSVPDPGMNSAASRSRGSRESPGIVPFGAAFTWGWVARGGEGRRQAGAVLGNYEN